MLGKNTHTQRKKQTPFESKEKCTTQPHTLLEAKGWRITQKQVFHWTTNHSLLLVYVCVYVCICVYIRRRIYIQTEHTLPTHHLPRAMNKFCHRWNHHRSRWEKRTHYRDRMGGTTKSIIVQKNKNSTGDVAVFFSFFFFFMVVCFLWETRFCTLLETG